MALIIQRRSDPFKKYWWLILLSFGAIGLWVSYPALGGNGGLPLANAEKGLRPATQSLDPADNPNGAPGGPVNLSMDSSNKKQSLLDPFASLLFSPPASPKNAVAPQAVKKGASFADALAQISSGGSSALAASPELQSPAVFPHGNFGSLSGLSGSETSSAFSGTGSGSGSSLGGLGGFGSHKPSISISSTHGLPDSGSSQSSGGSPMAALQSASEKMKSAANSVNSSAAGAMASQVFDGGAMGNALIGDPNGMAAGVGVQSLNGTPLNLKTNDHKLNTFHSNPVPVTPPIPPQKSMAQQILQMIMMALVGGVASAAGTGLVALL